MSTGIKVGDLALRGRGIQLRDSAGLRWPRLLRGRRYRLRHCANPSGGYGASIHLVFSWKCPAGGYHETRGALSDTHIPGRTLSLCAQRRHHHRLDRVHPVLGLVEHDAGRPLEHLMADLDAIGEALNALARYLPCSPRGDAAVDRDA